MCPFGPARLVTRCMAEAAAEGLRVALEEEGLCTRVEACGGGD